MKLAIRKEPGHIPNSGFHYMLHPIKMESEDQAAVFEMMGHIIVEVTPEHGERLIQQAIAALTHQLEVAHLTEKILFEKARAETK